MYFYVRNSDWLSTDFLTQIYPGNIACLVNLCASWCSNAVHKTTEHLDFPSRPWGLWTSYMMIPVALPGQNTCSFQPAIGRLFTFQWSYRWPQNTCSFQPFIVKDFLNHLFTFVTFPWYNNYVSRFSTYFRMNSMDFVPHFSDFNALNTLHKVSSPGLIIF